MTEFTDWPVHYKFPPFFTVQPNQETRTKQVSIWIQLVKDYCSKTRQFTIGKDHPIFQNPDISRSLPEEGRCLIFQEMVKAKEAEYVDNATQDRVFVWWQSQDTWAKRVMDAAGKNGLLNTVATLYELMNDVEELQGIDQVMLIRVLKRLEGQGKCELMMGAGGGVDGVKFFIS